MSGIFEDMVSAIVRPPRALYSSVDLGPNRLRCRGVEYKREDFDTFNDRNQKLKGSLWSLMHKNNLSTNNTDFCILYLHPNSGSRVDVVRTKIMAVAAQSQCAVCSFDFAGCGLSDGNHISLGVREKEDVSAILTYLLDRGYKRFMLWGRSMGAATSVMFYGAYKELLEGVVVAMLLDSPFTSFQGLADDYTRTKVNLPRLLLTPAVHYLKKLVEQKYNFDLLQMSPISSASSVDILTIVLSGRDDKIVSPALSNELYDHLGGPKLRVFFEGGHNTHRPPEIFEAIQRAVAGAVHHAPDESLLTELAAMLQQEEGTKEMLILSDVENRAKDNSTQRNDHTGKTQEKDLSNRIDGLVATPPQALKKQNSLSSPDVWPDTQLADSAQRNLIERSGSSFQTPEDMEREAEVIARETQEALSNLLKTKSLKKLTHTDVHMAISSTSRLPPRSLSDTTSASNGHSESAGEPSDSKIAHSTEKLHRASSCTDQSVGSTTSSPGSASNNDMMLLFGDKANRNGILGELPRNEACGWNAIPAVKVSHQPKSLHISNGHKAGENSNSEWPHHRPPPGTALSKPHIPIKVGRKPSSVLGVSMHCPKPHNNSISNRNGMSEREIPESTAAVEKPETPPPASSSWLELLSLGYLGGPSETDSTVMATKFQADFSPPQVDSWNKLASARAVAMVVDNVIDLTLNMAIVLNCEFSKKTFDLSPSIPDDQFDIMLSLAVAEISAELGSSSFVERDSVTWVSAIFSALDLPEGLARQHERNRKNIAPFKLAVGKTSSEKLDSLSRHSPVGDKKQRVTLHSISAAAALYGTSLVERGDRPAKSTLSDLHVTIPITTSHAHIQHPHHGKGVVVKTVLNGSSDDSKSGERVPSEDAEPTTPQGVVVDSY